MFIALKTKIWLTVLSIVLLFSFFSLFYFPKKQEQSLLKNYNNEVQNLANTVALGVKIALKEQNYEGVQTAMEFVKETPGLRFVSLLQMDTVWDKNHATFEINKTVFGTFPESVHPDPEQVSTDSVVVKLAPFESEMMNGAIMVGLSTDEIIESRKKIRNTSLLVSGGIFLFGIIIGFWLARSISVPVRALRDAARRVGEGDLTPIIENVSRDEIGELSLAFNHMVQDISKAREALHHTNHTLTDTNKLLHETVDNLKSTQAQLIHSEKMASLGELTAGIAHEIQNPLNFVNNFSEVNSELITEMREEIDKGQFDEAKKIATSIDENEQKIIFHGKRADAIVKGMLQHSRSSSGIKEPTNINTLADEYLRLAYHGLRAKDKTFNAAMKTDYDQSIGLVDIIPQDIGRVILNLITNAFYAVTEKKKSVPSTPQSTEGGIAYEPTVSVITKKQLPLPGGGGSNVEIHVKDNGNGIPQHILDKIFQPFFSTKPTGQGTGLGLSISYDIIKSHGGELRVESEEGKGAEFIIILPI